MLPGRDGMEVLTTLRRQDVIKKETRKQHPWIAMNLFKVFEEAKKRSLQRLSSLVNSHVAIPWSHIAVERAQTLFGEDVWPYGIEANRCTLEAFTQFCFEQGVTDRRVPYPSSSRPS
jgi:4,5-dihydroxyphthalate decarboxylase